MALEKIKELVNSPQIFKPWDYFSEAPKSLVCDASHIGLGSWIGQGEVESIRHCRFHCRKFSPGQLKYLIYQKELLAIIDPLKFFETQLRDQNLLFSWITNNYSPSFGLHFSGGSLSQEEGIPVKSAKLIKIESHHYPSSETPEIDIPELNITATPNPTHMWSAEEWAIRNAPIACHEPWGQQRDQNNPWDNNIEIVLDEERHSFFSTTGTTRSQHNAASGEASGTD